MARMSDFHVVGDPRYAPDAPSGGGGVSKEYVDNADINVKKTAANGHNSKYDETVIPSQYTNKLYVYGNPESMYPASDIGGEIPAITGGHASVDYNWWGQQVSNWTQNDYKTYGYDSETDKIFDKLCVVKCISQDDTRNAYYTILCTCDDQYITVNPNRTEPYLSLKDSHVAQKLYNQTYSGDPPTPQGYNLVTDVSYYAGNVIADFNYENNQYYDFEVSGIPLFVVNSNTQSEFDDVNHYIATGDYSNAVNYSELYPDNPTSYVAIDVISGDWYTVVNNAWVKQGTLDLNETGGTEVEANPQGTPADTLNSIEIDGTVYEISGGSGGGSVSANAYVVEAFTPNSNANTSRAAGFTFIPVFDLEVDAFQVWARTSSTVTVKLRKESSNEDIVSLENVSVSTGTWNNIPFASVILKAGESYIFWYHENGNALKYRSGAPTSGYLFASTVSNVWGSDYTAVPSSSENNRYGINLHISKVIIGSGGGGSTLPFEIVIDETDSGINIVYDDGGE